MQQQEDEDAHQGHHQDGRCQALYEIAQHYVGCPPSVACLVRDDWLAPLGHGLRARPHAAGTIT